MLLVSGNQYTTDNFKPPDRWGTQMAFHFFCSLCRLKSQGYGFCEFADPRAAEIAIRNLNDKDFKGEYDYFYVLTQKLLI